MIEKKIDVDDIHLSDILLALGIGLVLGFLFGISKSDVKYLTLAIGGVIIIVSYIVLRGDIK